MSFFTKYRSALLACTAVTVVAACTDSEIESPGTGDTVIVAPITGGGGASAFSTRDTAPSASSDCQAPLEFVSGVALPDGGGTTNFCSLTTGAGGTITGTVNVPPSADPILISGTVFLGDDTNSADV
ncbi:MAG: hypothetical protein AAFQ67_02540, partial [Pseudomonadota bacterium]